MGTYGYGERGRFTGRGPRGYQRSDERIREDINERLTEHPEIDASDIEVQVKGGEVTLTGTVDRRQTKRMAEDLCENVSGVKEVHNQLRVGEDKQETASTHSQPAGGAARNRYVPGPGENSAPGPFFCTVIDSTLEAFSPLEGVPHLSIYAFLDPDSAYPLPEGFNFDSYIEAEREFWALFPETDGQR